MTKRIRIVGLTMGLGLLLLLSTAPVAFAEGETSFFESELQKIRYNYDYKATQADDAISNPSGEDNMTLADLAQADLRPPEYKSPGKAFVYSLAVPGLGQLYSGSKIKPLVFLAVEVFGLTQAFKYHGNGQDLTAEFQRFNRDHWNVDTYIIGDDTLSAYDAYLTAAYGTANWDSLSDSAGITHQLPTTRTQQYYEMTGKYHQFSWGWDDATLRDQPLEYYLPDAPLMNRAERDNIPHSANRLTYETMRDDANKQYDKGMKMIFVVMGNHLISAFEAFFATKRHNHRLKYDQAFSNVDVKPSIRSYNEWKDTPYVTFSYKF